MYALIFGTKDGTVELLLLPSMTNDPPAECTWQTSTGQAVIGYFLTGELPLDSYDSEKQMRRAMFMHSGPSLAFIKPRYYYRDLNGKMMNQFEDRVSDDTYSHHNVGTIMPDGESLLVMPRVSNDTPDYRSIPQRFRTIALEAFVYGKAHLKNILIEYRSLRD